MNENWRDQAACQGQDGELFQLVENRERAPGTKPENMPRVRKALAFCARCTVVAECREEAESSLDYPLVGVWAGEYVPYETAMARVRAAKERVAALEAERAVKLKELRAAKGEDRDAA